jgi:hypothetical protein
MRLAKTAFSAILILTAGTGAVVQAGFPNLTVIYKFTQIVSTSTTSNTGFQTNFTCTNFGPQPVSLRFLVRDQTGAVVSTNNDVTNLAAGATVQRSTQGTFFYTNEGTLGISVTLTDGAAVNILSTSPRVHCSAQVYDASSVTPAAITNLNGVRYNQEPGAAE